MKSYMRGVVRLLVIIAVLSACGPVFRQGVTEEEKADPPLLDGGAQEEVPIPFPASNPILGDQSSRLSHSSLNPKYSALPLLEEQLAESLVQEKPFKLYKNVKGFCQLEGYEVTGPLYPKGFNYEGSLGYNESTDMSRWHKIKFHTMSNKEVTFIINLKAGSTSTKRYLAKVGKQVKSFFRHSFDAAEYRRLSISGKEKRSFVDWFFARHGMKHIFSVIREPYSRLDSATGTVLASDTASERKKEVVAEKYRDGAFHSSYEHLYPQTYFLTHSRNITLFSITDQIGPNLKRWLEDIYPGKSIPTDLGHQNQRQGGQYDTAMAQYLIDTGNRRFLRDYIYDEMLWDRAQKLKC